MTPDIRRQSPLTTTTSHPTLGDRPAWREVATPYEPVTYKSAELRQKVLKIVLFGSWFSFCATHSTRHAPRDNSPCQPHHFCASQPSACSFSRRRHVSVDKTSHSPSHSSPDTPRQSKCR